MSRTVTITLDDELLSFAEDLVERGWFGSVEEVLLGGLRRLQHDGADLDTLEDDLFDEAEEDEAEALEDDLLTAETERSRISS
ncbi:ribbon-helix-helix domain-containing protein [Xaviernesmea oryzae]|nr:type II toxin-antitoxin system ParD family antitoxin [Xaviernesmea oryzae]SEK26969.1 putative addiction module antidote protein, CC2985 family [Xaviernesmea oryzae]